MNQIQHRMLRAAAYDFTLFSHCFMLRHMKPLGLRCQQDLCIQVELWFVGNVQIKSWGYTSRIIVYDVYIFLTYELANIHKNTSATSPTIQRRSMESNPRIQGDDLSFSGKALRWLFRNEKPSEACSKRQLLLSVRGWARRAGAKQRAETN